MKELPEFLPETLQPNPQSVQLRWCAIPAIFRDLKIFSGPPHGEIPTDRPFLYTGMGGIPFKGYPMKEMFPIHAKDSK